MSLKKSDKIVAIIGVIILIIAGVFIFMYSSPEEVIPVVSKEKTYTFTWVAHEENITFTDKALKNKEYLSDIVIDLSKGKVLTAVNFWINWKDDYTRGLFFRKGEDTLTAKVTYFNEEINHKSVKKADESFGNFIINDIPQDETYSTKDENFDPIEYIRQKYLDQNTATFNLSVKVKTGEKLLTIRPLKLLNYFLDKGNDFNIIISYKYYDFTIEEQEENIPPTSNQGDKGDIYSHLTKTGFK